MEHISFEQITLSNGLQVIFHENRSLPIVSVNLWYHVGSKNERPGKTGLAHLFEHLMFEGSKNHNSSHFEPLQEVGGALNGSTNNDRTNYWENVPSNYLELALWLEADRMGFLLDALDQRRLDLQRNVVKNERRQSYENRPYGSADLTLQSLAYPQPHPYHWPVIGFMEDLDSVTLDDAHSFHRRYYAPSNASLTIAGDFDVTIAKTMVERYFGSIPGGPTIPLQDPVKSSLHSLVDSTLYHRVTLPRCYFVWPSVPRFHPDEASLSLLASILGSGKTSRLHRRLVYDSRMAQSVSAQCDAAELAGDFGIQATIAVGHEPHKIQHETALVIDSLRQAPPTADEMARVKNQLEWRHVRQMANVGGFGGRANGLNYFNVYGGNPELINTDIDRFLSVTPDDIWRVANEYLRDIHVQLTVLPETTSASTVPSLDRTIQPVSGSRPIFTPPPVQRAELVNGIDILLVEQHDIPAVAFGIFIPTGAVAETTSLSGLASITAAMLHEGTTSRSSHQIAEEIEFIGSNLSIGTGREQTSLVMSTLTREWGHALELMADLLQHSTFPDNEFSRVRTRRLGEVQRLRDDPESLAARAFRALTYGSESSYGRHTAGTEASVKRITRDAVANYFHQNFGPSRAVLAVVGDVSLDEATAVGAKALQVWTKPGFEHPDLATSKRKAVETTTIYLLNKPGAAQSVIQVGLVGVPRHHPNYFPLIIVNHIFGGQFTARLNMNLRQDKGYSYGYHSSISWHKESSMLAAGGSVETAVTAVAVSETLREFQDIQWRRPISQEEFESAKTTILRQFPSSFETPWQILARLSPLIEFGLSDNYLQTSVASIEAVSLADARSVANQYFDYEHLTIVVVGDQSQVEESLRNLGLPLVHVDAFGHVKD